MYNVHITRDGISGLKATPCTAWKDSIRFSVLIFNLPQLLDILLYDVCFTPLITWFDGQTETMNRFTLILPIVTVIQIGVLNAFFRWRQREWLHTRQMEYSRYGRLVAGDRECFQKEVLMGTTQQQKRSHKYIHPLTQSLE